MSNNKHWAENAVPPIVLKILGIILLLFSTLLFSVSFVSLSLLGIAVGLLLAAPFFQLGYLFLIKSSPHYKYRTKKTPIFSNFTLYLIAIALTIYGVLCFMRGEYNASSCFVVAAACIGVARSRRKKDSSY